MRTLTTVGGKNVLTNRESRLKRVERITETPMTLFAVFTIPLLLGPYLWGDEPHLGWDFAVWSVFALELLVRAFLAPGWTFLSQVPLDRRSPSGSSALLPSSAAVACSSRCGADRRWCWSCPVDRADAHLCDDTRGGLRMRRANSRTGDVPDTDRCTVVGTGYDVHGGLRRHLTSHGYRKGRSCPTPDRRDNGFRRADGQSCDSDGQRAGPG